MGLFKHYVNLWKIYRLIVNLSILIQKKVELITEIHSTLQKLLTTELCKLS